MVRSQSQNYFSTLGLWHCILIMCTLKTSLKHVVEVQTAFSKSVEQRYESPILPPASLLCASIACTKDVLSVQILKM